MSEDRTNAAEDIENRGDAAEDDFKDSQNAEDVGEDAEVPESEPATLPSSGVRKQVDETLSKEETPLTFEKATLLASVAFEDLDDLVQFAEACKKDKLIWIDKRGGRRAVPIRTKSKAKRKKSKALCDLINEHGMAFVRIAEKAKRRRNKKSQRTAPETPEINVTELAQDALKAIPEIWDKDDLGRLRYKFVQLGHINRIQGPKKRREHVAVEGKELSQELIDAFDKQFHAIFQEERVKAQIEQAMDSVENAESSQKLFGMCKYWLDQKLKLLRLVRTGRKQTDWKVEPIDDKSGSHQLVEVVMQKKAELEQSETTSRAREDIMNLTSQYTG